MTSFLKDTKGTDHEKFYDSNTGKLLFTAPVDRSWSDWIEESKNHGWPSFRDNEVNWDNVRVLPNGETVSVDGTHLVSHPHLCTWRVVCQLERPHALPSAALTAQGHNIPDKKGNRFCINLVSIAGNPSERRRK
jgi:peptide methionine sulfoxide reductase MsrB